MSKFAISTITSKSQTVIPRPVRERLGVGPGDKLRYVETSEGVMIQKLVDDADDPFLALSEWSTPADDEGYADL